MIRDEIFLDMLTGLPKIANGISFLANRAFDDAREPPTTDPPPPTACRHGYTHVYWFRLGLHVSVEVRMRVGVRVSG